VLDRAADKVNAVADQLDLMRQHQTVALRLSPGLLQADVVQRGFDREGSDFLHCFKVGAIPLHALGCVREVANQF